MMGRGINILIYIGISTDSRSARIKPQVID